MRAAILTYTAAIFVTSLSAMADQGTSSCRSAVQKGRQLMRLQYRCTAAERKAIQETHARLEECVDADRRFEPEILKFEDFTLSYVETCIRRRGR